MMVVCIYVTLLAWADAVHLGRCSVVGQMQLCTDIHIICCCYCCNRIENHTSLLDRILNKSKVKKKTNIILVMKSWDIYKSTEGCVLVTDTYKLSYLIVPQLHRGLILLIPCLIHTMATTGLFVILLVWCLSYHEKKIISFDNWQSLGLSVSLLTLVSWDSIERLRWEWMKRKCSLRSRMKLKDANSKPFCCLQF